MVPLCASCAIDHANMEWPVCWAVKASPTTQLRRGGWVAAASRAQPKANSTANTQWMTGRFTRAESVNPYHSRKVSQNL